MAWGRETVAERLPRRLFFVASSLLVTALLFDLMDLSTGTGALGLLAYWLAAAGLLLGVAAALWRLCHLGPLQAIASLWRLSARPGFFKAAGLALFAGAWLLRTPEGNLPAAALMLAVLAVAFILAAPLLRQAAVAGLDGGNADDPTTAPAGGLAAAATERLPRAS